MKGGAHFALQLSNSFRKVSLGGFWQLRVEALGEALPAALLVFTLRGKNTNLQVKIRSVDWSGFIFHLCLCVNKHTNNKVSTPKSVSW